MNENIADSVAAANRKRFEIVKEGVRQEADTLLHSRHPKGFRARASGHLIVDLAHERYLELGDRTVNNLVEYHEISVLNARARSVRAIQLSSIASAVLGVLGTLVIV